jgi:hypothetical protein
MVEYILGSLVMKHSQTCILNSGTVTSQESLMERSVPWSSFIMSIQSILQSHAGQSHPSSPAGTTREV